MDKVYLTRSMLLSAFIVSASPELIEFHVYGFQNHQGNPKTFFIQNKDGKVLTNFLVNFGIESIKTPSQNSINVALYVSGLFLEYNGYEDPQALREFYNSTKRLMEEEKL